MGGRKEGYGTLTSSLFCSYEIMQTCWLQDPNERPTFAHLNERIDRYLMELAGYVSMGPGICFPELQRGGGGHIQVEVRKSFIGNSEEEDGQILSDVAINIITPGGDKEAFL